MLSAAPTRKYCAFSWEHLDVPGKGSVFTAQNSLTKTQNLYGTAAGHNVKHAWIQVASRIRTARHFAVHWHAGVSDKSPHENAVFRPYQARLNCSCNTALTPLILSFSGCTLPGNHARWFRPDEQKQGQNYVVTTMSYYPSTFGRSCETLPAKSLFIVFC